MRNKRKSVGAISIVLGSIMMAVGSYMIGKYHGKHEAFDEVIEKLEEENVNE